jgi:ribosomal protein L7/L12
MEILVIGGVVVLLILMVVIRSVLTHGERSGYQMPHSGAVPEPYYGAASGDKTVSITQLGPKKIEVIKVIREYTGLGLKEAKDLADAAEKMPVVVATNLSAPVAADFRRDLLGAGANAGQASSPAFISPPTSTSGVTLQIEWVDVGPKKIEVIKVIRDYTAWGLKEAKDATETTSFTVTMPEDRATGFLLDLRAAGAVANVHGI